MSAAASAVHSQRSRKAEFRVSSSSCEAYPHPQNFQAEERTCVVGITESARHTAVPRNLAGALITRRRQRLECRILNIGCCQVFGENVQTNGQTECRQADKRDVGAQEAGGNRSDGCSSCPLQDTFTFHAHRWSRGRNVSCEPTFCFEAENVVRT